MFRHKPVALPCSLFRRLCPEPPVLSSGLFRRLCRKAVALPCALFRRLCHKPAVLCSGLFHRFRGSRLQRTSWIGATSTAMPCLLWHWTWAGAALAFSAPSSVSGGALRKASAILPCGTMCVHRSF